MIKMVRGIEFRCPDCEVKPRVDGAGITEDGRVFVVGVCPDCHAGVAVDIEKIIASLSGSCRRDAN